MRLGFNWAMGPFEMLRSIGVKNFIERIDNLENNNSAEIHRFKDFNIVEFTTKACALDYDSMDALKNATDKPLIVINESMQFSAGVNLSYTMNFADKGDFKSIEKFIKYFQDTCKTLKYSK